MPNKHYMGRLRGGVLLIHFFLTMQRIPFANHLCLPALTILLLHLIVLGSACISRHPPGFPFVWLGGFGSLLLSQAAENSVCQLFLLVVLDCFKFCLRKKLPFANSPLRIRHLESQPLRCLECGGALFPLLSRYAGNSIRHLQNIRFDSR